MMESALVLLSGGIDSAVALGWASRNFKEVRAISFQYHLRPFQEQVATHRLLRHFPARLVEIPLPFLKEASDAGRQSTQLPEGYVPNRNMIFYSIAAHFAELWGCNTLVGGHTAEDREAFPDASATFFGELEKLFNHALLSLKVKIKLPLVNWTKREVLQKAHEWNVPLQYTWSCYWDGPGPCQNCVSCRERAEAFQSIGRQDPLLGKVHAP